MSKTIEERERVVVRFAGDSGDGMQLAGTRFTDATAVLGNDLATLPNFPAEIRAPAGTLAGVSAFQIHFASRDILTPGDRPNVLVAMNPAALKANLAEIERGAMVIVNEDAFSKRNLEKAGLRVQPARGRLAGELPRPPDPDDRADDGAPSRRLRTPRRATPAGRRTCSRSACCRGSTAGRPTSPRSGSSRSSSAKPAVLKANLAAFNAGWSFGETTELLDVQYRVKPVAGVPPGTYRNVNGTTALSLGLIAASVRSRLPLLLASYPITPASELLHELSRHQSFGVRTIQAEDEIAAAGMALGAAFGGRLGVTATSGPGMDLKAETIGLAVMLELPMIVIDVQRAGPSTGMPTKTEQSDLLMALYGRHGESPLPVLAPSTPAGCFDAAFEAVQIAIRYRTPVIILSDTFLASSSEPWRIPDVAERAGDRARVRDAAAAEARRSSPTRATTGSRGRGRSPGTPGLAAPDRRAREGRPDRQHLLRRRQPRADDRAARGEGRRDRRRAAAARGRRRGRARSCWCWDGARARARSAPRVRRARLNGHKVASAHLRHLNPLPTNTGDVLRVVRPGADPGDEHRPARAGAARASSWSTSSR